MNNKIALIASTSIAIIVDVASGVTLIYSQYLKISVYLLIISNVILLISFLRFFLSKEYRLFKNIKRPIKIINTQDNLMENEIKTLKKVGFFNLEDSTFDHKSTDFIDEHGLIILGYSDNMEYFNNIIDGVKKHKLPLIIYSKVYLNKDHEKYLRDNYSWYSICNFPLKLLNDVFTIASTFPLDKNK